MRSILALAALSLLGCAGQSAFRLSSEDNNPVALASASRAVSPSTRAPVNGQGKPLSFLVTAGSSGNRRLIAWDLAERKQVWAVDADITSRVVVGSRFVASREGTRTICARAIADGRKLWSHDLGSGVFLGAAADGDRVFYVVQENRGSRSTWSLVALGGNGSEIWRKDAPGTLGAPAARGGLVFSPYLAQWLTILDGATGRQLSRIRNSDEAIGYVRENADGVFYGSKGVFALDERSAAGTRAAATYVQAAVPEEFVRIFYHWDAFNPVQAGYSAFDRNRILWRTAARENGRLEFTDDLVVVFSYRFFFAFDAKTGKLRWAHNHPRNDIVAAEHTGTAIVYASVEGEIGALDPKSGTHLYKDRAGARLLGATFDADGYRPAELGQGELPETTAALASIVWDKDSRFQPVKLFALVALGQIPGREVTTALLKVLLDENTPQGVYAKAADVLVSRGEPDAAPLLIDALKVRFDFISGTRPRATGVIARALGALGRSEAVPQLVFHLEDPETPALVLKDVIDALGQCKSSDALGPLRSFILLYHIDPPATLGDGGGLALQAAIDAILSLSGGGAAERELVAYVAEEPRTDAKLAEYARLALAPHTSKTTSKTK